MLIKAKYIGKCRVCCETINVGDWIYWSSGVGCNHQKCGDDFTKNVLAVKNTRKPFTKLEMAAYSGAS